MWLLDCGASSTAGASHVFVSHTHLDHIAHAPLLTHLGKPLFHIPAASRPAFERFLAAAEAMDANEDAAASALPRGTRVLGHAPGDEFEIESGGHYMVRVLRTCHVVPSIGFAFFAVKKTLRPELAGLPTAEIAALARAGQQVSVATRTPLFAYLGDTTPAVFAEEPWLLEQMPVVVTETTFIDDDLHVGSAEAHGHTVWNELRPIIVAHPNTTFVLTHASMRFSSDRIRDFYAAQHLPNVVPWVPAAPQVLQ